MHFECILEHSACILDHSGTFWNSLEHSGTFWNILEHSGTFWNSLEHSGTVKIAYFERISDWNSDRQTDIRTCWAASSQLKRTRLCCLKGRLIHLIFQYTDRSSIQFQDTIVHNWINDEYFRLHQDWGWVVTILTLTLIKSASSTHEPQWSETRSSMISVRMIAVIRWSVSVKTLMRWSASLIWATVIPMTLSGVCHRKGKFYSIIFKEPKLIFS